MATTTPAPSPAPKPANAAAPPTERSSWKAPLRLSGAWWYGQCPCILHAAGQGFPFYKASREPGLGWDLCWFSAPGRFFSREGEKKAHRAKQATPPPAPALAHQGGNPTTRSGFSLTYFFVFFGGPKAPGLWCFLRAACPPVCARARARSRREGGREAPTRVRARAFSRPLCPLESPIARLPL